jgi:3-methyl-2-oxobutanoate hydroxymethyltransferase
MPGNKEIKKVTTNTLLKMKAAGEKISMLTAYDFSFARIIDQAGIDVLLVGDSASNVMAGHETTLPITLDQMIYHASSVIRGTDRCLVVVDLPFGSYQSNSDIALASSIRIMKETGAHSVKLEGGEEVMDSVKKIVQAGIPVMGHLGLTPQSIYKFGTYTVRAKEEDEANKLRKDALLLEKAGCFAIVLEKIPAALAKKFPKAFQFPRSVSVPVVIAMDRFWSCTICWGSPLNSNQDFYGNT